MEKNKKLKKIDRLIQKKSQSNDIRINYFDNYGNKNNNIVNNATVKRKK